jgi:pilus assembly protein FimV
VREIYIVLFTVFACCFMSQVKAQSNQIQGPQTLGVQSSQIQGASDNTQVYSGVVYGPIDQNDTLWRIASRYNQDKPFTVFQTMLAIFELNVQAFENGNFNSMVNGATLQLPSDRYINRIDSQRARARADSDARALGRLTTKSNNQTPNEPVDAAANASAPISNMKPEVPLVNQDDLSKTSSQLQSQLNGLRLQQRQQFEALKSQVAASISSVEGLLVENKKLNDQLIKIDENNRKLTAKVETELQIQIDQQVEQLSQLITLVKDAEQRRIDEESKSILTILASPFALVIIMAMITLMTIFGLAVFLLRKPTQVAVINDEPATQDIVDEELVIGELSDQLDQDSEDLMAALSNDNTLVEDDILSDALEDEDAISSLSDMDFDVELDGLDDMLVPDSPTAISDIKVSEKSDNVEFDIEDDVIMGDDSTSIEDDDDMLSLGEGIASHELSESDDLSRDSDDSIEAQNDNNTANNTSEYTEEPKESNSASVDIDLDKIGEIGEIDEDVIEQIGKKIEAIDETITRMADEILDELDESSNDGVDTKNVVEKSSGDNFSSEEPLNTIKDLAVPDEIDDITQANTPEPSADSKTDIANDLDDIANEPLSDLEDDEDSSQELDALLDEIDDDVDSNINEDDADIDDLVDPSADNDNAFVDAEPNDQVSALADELLQALENESNEHDELDKVLDELEDTTRKDGDSQANSDVEINETKDTDSSVDVADSAEVNSSEPESATKSLILDADDLMDDIPSFTSGLSTDDGSNDNKSKNDKIVDDLSATESLHEADKTETAKPNEKADEPKAAPPVLRPEISKSVNMDEADASNGAEANDDGLNKSEVDLELEDPLNVIDESDEDVLSGLQGLDNWLDEDEDDSTDPNTEANSGDVDLSGLTSDENELDSLEDGLSLDEDLISGLDDADFDDMLNDLALDSDVDNESNTTIKQAEDPLATAGLDLDALMTDDSSDAKFENITQHPQKGNKDSQIDGIDDFINVDDLLEESNATAQMSDSDKDLDLANSLDMLISPQQGDLSLSSVDIESDQSSNLDLAQVYMDMEDFDAAKELLDEVGRLGSHEQQQEANELLAKIKS